MTVRPFVPTIRSLQRRLWREQQKTDADGRPASGHVHTMSAQGGGTLIADALSKLSKGGCVKRQTGRGSKNPKILKTSYVLGPQANEHVSLWLSLSGMAHRLPSGFVKDLLSR